MTALRVALKSLRQQPAELLAALLAIALGTAALTFFLSLGRGAERAVVDDLLTQLPVNVVKLQPRGGLNFGPLQLGSESLLSPGLDEGTRLQLAKLPGVQAAYGLNPSRFPMRASGGEAFLGRKIYTDMFAVGIDPKFVADEVKSALFYDPGPDAGSADKPIPVIASTQVLKIYNSTLAPAIGVPRINRSAVKNIEFDLYLGESYAAGKRKNRRKVRARLVGLSKRVPLAGISVAMPLMQRWNRQYAEQKKVLYKAVFVVTDSARDIETVVAKAKQMGLQIDDSAQLAGRMLRAVTALLSLLAGLILLLAAALTAKTFAARNQAKRKEIALLIALGSSPRQVQNMLLAEVIWLGLFGAVLGQVIGLAAALLAERSLAPILNALVSKPLHLLQVDVWVFVVPILLALLFAWLGGLGPARRAAREDPVLVLGNSG